METQDPKTPHGGDAATRLVSLGLFEDGPSGSGIQAPKLVTQLGTLKLLLDA